VLRAGVDSKVEYREAQLTPEAAHRAFTEARVDQLTPYRKRSETVSASVPLNDSDDPGSPPVALTLEATEESYNSVTKQAKERQRDIKSMTAFMQELATAHRSYSKSLLRLSKSAENVIKEEVSARIVRQSVVQAGFVEG
jgi:hypothetical protein